MADDNLTCGCGGEVGIWHGNDGSGAYYYAECCGCGVKTDHRRTRRRAKWAWQNRPARLFGCRDCGGGGCDSCQGTGDIRARLAVSG